MAGIVQDYSWNKGTIVMDRAEYARLFDDPFVDLYHHYARRGLDRDAAKARGERSMGKSALAVESQASFREYLANVIRRVYTLAYVQQVVVGVVAALGVVTALAHLGPATTARAWACCGPSGRRSRRRPEDGPGRGGLDGGLRHDPGRVDRTAVWSGTS